MMKNKKWVNYALFGIGLIILILFLLTTNFSEIKKGLSYLNLRILIVLIILVFLTIIIRGYRWKALIKTLTKKKISMSLAMSSMVAGVAAGILTPGRGFEIAKPLILKGTHNIPLTKSVSAMIIEKVFDMLGYVFIFFLSILLLPKGIQNKLIILAVSVIFVIIFLVFIFPRELSIIFNFFLNKIYLPKSLKKKFIKLNAVLFMSFSKLNRKGLAWFGIISIGEVFLEGFVLYFIFIMLNIKISFFLTLFAFTGAVLFSLLTMIPGGIGVNEVSQAGIIRSVEPASAGQMGLIRTGILIHAIIGYYLLIVIGAVILMFFKRFTGKNKKT